MERAIASWHDYTWPGKSDDRVIGAKLAEEVGEVCGALIKIPEGRRALTDLQDEMGDALIVLSVLAGRHGWTLEDLRARRWTVVAER